MMFKHIKAMIPDYIWSHENFWIPADEPEHFDGETDNIGQAYPVVSVRNLPKYGSRTEDDHPKVPKGLTQAQRNEDHLVEWFAGWAIMKSDKYRKFTVISRKPHLERWKKMHHVRFPALVS